MSRFGFSTKTSDGGDFLPVLKYDARAGRFFRIDRVVTADGFASEPTDITTTFKAIFDFENLETGWVNFVAGQAPSMVLVPVREGMTELDLPPQPSEQHKHGLRLMLKLAKDCAGNEPPVREMAGQSKAFVGAIETAYDTYIAEKGKNPGKLPVYVCEKINTVKSGTGARSSTNFHPVFKLVGWAERGDLVFVPKAQVAPSAATQSLKQAQPYTNGSAPPSTGSMPPQAPAPSRDSVSADDFG